ncbi:LLM class flavin-dependent oxidoreductase [Propionibacteriaceae bacterium G1746]|uniref:LLM class flavin-dependent oxidoreductase n=1 Tax=Aestuariimicrobium sp. G57 TaxID=3418485 RepID=UPI003C1CE381
MTDAPAVTAPVPLSVLDLASLVSGRSSADALNDTIWLAQQADKGGFNRFWVAEHHNTTSVASTNPPVLISALGAHTERIKVGSGGVMLPNHAPYVVAEQFALLEALYPGRVDLGIGRAPGTDPMTAAALRRTTDTLGVEEFPHHVLQVMHWLGDERLDEPMVQRLEATPAPTSHPEVWLLGSSGYSAQLAGMLGLRYCYAHHFGGMDPESVFDAYRGRFEPSAALDEPHAMICTSAISADSAEEADYLAGPARIMWLGIRSGAREPVVSPEEAASRELSAMDELVLAQMPGTKFVGSHDDVTEQLKALVANTGVQELMLTSTTFDIATKFDTYQAIAQRWR